MRAWQICTLSWSTVHAHVPHIISQTKSLYIVWNIIRWLKNYIICGLVSVACMYKCFVYVHFYHTCNHNLTNCTEVYTHMYMYHRVHVHLSTMRSAVHRFVSLGDDSLPDTKRSSLWLELQLGSTLQMKSTHLPLRLQPHLTSHEHIETLYMNKSLT